MVTNAEILPYVIPMNTREDSQGTQTSSKKHPLENFQASHNGQEGRDSGRVRLLRIGIWQVCGTRKPQGRERTRFRVKLSKVLSSRSKYRKDMDHYDNYVESD